MGNMRSQAVGIALVAITALLACSFELQAQPFNTPIDYTFVEDKVLVDPASVSGESILARVGDLVVVNQEDAPEDAAAMADSTQRSMAPPRFLIQDAMGRYGTTDGMLLVKVVELRDLDDVALDYNLDLAQRYEPVSVGLFRVSDVSAIAQKIAALRADSRTVYVTVNTTFYDVKPN